METKHNVSCGVKIDLVNRIRIRCWVKVCIWLFSAEIAAESLSTADIDDYCENDDDEIDETRWRDGYSDVRKVQMRSCYTMYAGQAVYEKGRRFKPSARLHAGENVDWLLESIFLPENNQYLEYIIYWLCACK